MARFFLFGGLLPSSLLPVIVMRSGDGLWYQVSGIMIDLFAAGRVEILIGAGYFLIEVRSESKGS
eukprot:scaffold326144_cov79-Cyclotella_meneghiniana.AAC.1